MIELQLDREMPNNCGECPFKCVKKGDYHCVVSGVNLKDNCFEKRPFWCRLHDSRKIQGRLNFKTQLCDGHVHLTAKDFICHQVTEGYTKQQMQLKKYANNPALAEGLREILYQQIYNINQLDWYKREWHDILERYRKLRDGEDDPVEIETEGGGSTWWYVCGDCHGAIDNRDIYCKHCWRKLKW